jgi:hypothetical protein
MTPEHEKFIEALSKKAPFTAAELQRHWNQGTRYYIDSRVDLTGHRRTFNRLNETIKETSYV